jgi:hypothetical protein
MIDTAQLSSLAESLTGEVVASNGLDNESSPTYFYGEYERRRPRAVVRAAGTADVATVVRYARDTGISLTVRAGGHSIMGHSSTDGGLLVDLARLKGIEVDTEDGPPGLTAESSPASTPLQPEGTGWSPGLGTRPRSAYLASPLAAEWASSIASWV